YLRSHTFQLFKQFALLLDTVERKPSLGQWMTTTAFLVPLDKHRVCGIKEQDLIMYRRIVFKFGQSFIQCGKKLTSSQIDDESHFFDIAPGLYDQFCKLRDQHR